MNEIPFIRHFKVWIQHYNIIHWFQIFYAWPTFWPQ